MASTKALQAELAALEQRVSELLKVCRRLAEENHSLKNSQDQLVNERAELVAKQEDARSRVEAMINRLKALEQES